MRRALAHRGRRGDAGGEGLRPHLKGLQGIEVQRRIVERRVVGGIAGQVHLDGPQPRLGRLFPKSGELRNREHERVASRKRRVVARGGEKRRGGFAARFGQVAGNAG